MNKCLRKGKLSQCSCCERMFLVDSEEVLYCSWKCKEDHNMFKQNELNQTNKKARHGRPGNKQSV